MTRCLKSSSKTLTPPKTKTVVLETVPENIYEMLVEDYEPTTSTPEPVVVKPVVLERQPVIVLPVNGVSYADAVKRVLEPLPPQNKIMGGYKFAKHWADETSDDEDDD